MAKVYLPAPVATDGTPALSVEIPRLGVLATSHGVKADGIKNDTLAMQAAIDEAIAKGLPLICPPGTILTGPLDLNGTGHAEPADAQWAGVTHFVGAGQRRTVFKALAGAYVAGQPVLKLKNVAGATAGGFFVDCNNVADYGADFSWIGGNSGNPAIAPSPRNTIQDLWLENALVTNGILGQQNDCKISNIRSGPCAGPVGLSIIAAGGLVTMDNVVVTQGLFEIACQNGQLSQCAFFNGIRLAGASFNHINWGGSHIYGNPATSITIDSTATGNATRGMVFEGAFFPTTTSVIAGRYHQGIKFIACQFNNYTNMFGAITAASGSGSTPWFVFELCSFQNGTPAGVDGQYRVDIQHCRDSTGAVIEAQSWRTYTPTWTAGGTAVTLGAGTVNARWVWRGQEVHVRIAITLAADSVIPAGAWTIGVPRQSSANGRGLGTMWMFDSSSAANHVGAVRISGSATTANLMHSNANLNSGLVDSASPFAWAANDQFVIDAVYEVA